MIRYLFSIATVLATAALTFAQNQGPMPTTLYPAPLPSPALKYRLLPDLRDQTAGNAMPLYQEAIDKLKPLERDPDERPKWQELFPKWADTPLQALPRDEVRKALEPYQEILELVDKATRREYCDWDLPQRLRKGGFSTLLPEVQFHRTLGNLLALRARLAMADGDWTQAVHFLQTGLALAKHVGEQPTVINFLVGTAVANVVVRQVDEFVQQPKAPNLYWALSDLPRPLIDGRKGFEGERIAVYSMFPGVAEAMTDLNAGPVTEEQTQKCVNTLLQFGGNNPLDVVRRKLTLAKYLTDHFSENQKVLLDQGRPKDKVDKMPHVQVGVMAQLCVYEQMSDEQAKLLNEPYYKVADQLERLAKAVKAKPPGLSILPEEGFYALIPAFVRLHQVRTRLQRKVEILRCGEAIRFYASAHEGKLPAVLDEIKEVPIPLDPATGKPFDYKVTGDKLTLKAPVINREGKRAFDEVVYEITMKK